MFVFLALIAEVEVLADAAMPPRSPGDEFTTLGMRGCGDGDIVARMGLYGDLRVEAVIEDHIGAVDGSSNLHDRTSASPLDRTGNANTDTWS